MGEQSSCIQGAIVEYWLVIFFQFDEMKIGGFFGNKVLTAEGESYFLRFILQLFAGIFEINLHSFF